MRKLLGSDAIANIPGRGDRFTAQLASNDEVGPVIKQRLAAIMAADVAGYSRLMGADENATVIALDASRAVFKTRIGSAGRRVVDMAGDSVLAVLGGDRSRLNGSCNSRRAPGPGRRSLRRPAHALSHRGFLDQGEQMVKNIPDPLRVFKVISGSRAPTVSRVVEGEWSSDSMRDSAHSPAGAVPERLGIKPFAPPGAPPTLLGRDDELVALDHLLAQHRHVTVLGAGGIGKTSLALAAAHARRHAQRDGVAWVDLSSISEPALVCAVVARALELPVASGEHQMSALLAV